MVLQCFCGLAQGARGIDHVVHDKAASAFHITDDVHNLRFIGGGSTFVDNRQVHVQLLGYRAGSHYTTHVR